MGLFNIYYFLGILFGASVVGLLYGLSRAPHKQDSVHENSHKSTQNIIELFPFRNISLPWDVRVKDLVSRLTIEEIAQQMSHGGDLTKVPPIQRLGIGPYHWGAECLHGDGLAGGATSFPQALGLAASFSRELISNVSRATGLEVRAKHNYFIERGDYGFHTGLNCWSPVINILRDPRWGRNQETYGEDPWLSGELAEAFLYGLHGNHPRYILVSGGCKHYAVYSGPENIPISRHRNDVKVSEYDLRMTFLPHYQKCVAAGAFSFMCSYSSINGVPACANSRLLRDVLREEWGFKGFVVSDEGAIQDIYANYHYTESVEKTAAAAVNAGCNLELGPALPVEPFFSQIPEAVHQGLLNVTTLIEAVTPLFYTRMRLGEFDPPELNPYTKLQQEDYIQTATHRELAVLAAMKSFVLLKNDHFLPFLPATKFSSIAIIGPLANNLGALYGDYAPTVMPQFAKTPLEGLKGLGTFVYYHPGCEDSDPLCNDYDRYAVLNAISNTKLIIVCLGTDTTIEGESSDKTDISLPGFQDMLLRDVIDNAGVIPVILLLFNAGPLDVSVAQSAPEVKVIIECFYPGQSAGEALLRVFLNNGTGANPAARLPLTWPSGADLLPPMTSYSMQGRTYRYTSTRGQYPFGYGLSYTRWHYSNLTAEPEKWNLNTNLTVHISLANTGKHSGEEVIQLYIEWQNKSYETPVRQLVGFRRVFVASGKSKTIEVTIQKYQLRIWHQDGYIVPTGKYRLTAGGQQPDQLVTVGSNVLSTLFTVI